MQHLGQFMNRTFNGRLTADRIKAIRDRWKGKLVVKGIVNPEDCALVADLGADGIIVSNHGGRQLEVGTSTIAALPRLAKEFGDRLEILFDSGLRGGPDIACAIASGASFLLGRSFMYGICAMGAKGGPQVMEMASSASSPRCSNSSAARASRTCRATSPASRERPRRLAGQTSPGRNQTLR